MRSAFVNYDQAHNAYTAECFQDPEELHAASVTYEKELRKKQEFIERVGNWMQNAQIEELSEIQPSDSVSQNGSSFVAKGSHRSSGSSSSRLSVKIKVAKAEKAVAQLKLHQLKKKIELQQKRDAVQREQELLGAENEVERATLKAHNLEEEDELEEFSVPSQPREDGLSVTTEKSPAPSSVFDKPPPLAVSAKKEKISTVTLDARVTLNPVTPEWSGKPYGSECITSSRNEVSPPGGNLQQLLQQQQQMIQIQQQTFQSMASTIRQGFALPKPELNKFDGNPLEFWNFIRSFETNIEKNASDESEKLSFLLQYCTGAARNAIKSCVSIAGSCTWIPNC